MRTAVIVILVMVAASPSHASKSCMTQVEARAQFATSHLYWHGPNHCWDATAPQRRMISRARPKAEPRDEQQAEDDSAVPAKREPKWRNAMSEMLPADTPVLASSASSLAGIATSGMNWLDRWVDVTQVAPPSFFRRNTDAAAANVSTPAAAQKSDPLAMRLILVFLSIVVILAVIELLFRNTIHERLD
jgi:hypothetical protein